MPTKLSAAKGGSAPIAKGEGVETMELRTGATRRWRRRTARAVVLMVAAAVLPGHVGHSHVLAAWDAGEPFAAVDRL